MTAPDQILITFDGRRSLWILFKLAWVVLRDGHVGLVANNAGFDDEQTEVVA